MADDYSAQSGSYRRPRPGGKRGFQPRRKVCIFCANKDKKINWKNLDDLRRFTSEAGYIRSRRKTGTCARHQRALAVAVKRARLMAMLPFSMEHVRTMGKG